MKKIKMVIYTVWNIMIKLLMKITEVIFTKFQLMQLKTKKVIM